MSIVIQKRIYDIRLADPEKSKYEIQEELKREGIICGQSAIQNFINKNKELLNIQHYKKVKKHKNYKIARWNHRGSEDFREKNI